MVIAPFPDENGDRSGYKRGRTGRNMNKNIKVMQGLHNDFFLGQNKIASPGRQANSGECGYFGSQTALYFWMR
jgi:hypothetical protein